MSTLYFSGPQCKITLIEQFKSAKHSINIAVYIFTDLDLLNELIAANKKGIAIKIIIDDNENNKRIIDEIKKTNIHLQIISKNKGIMHQKICIIDNKIALTGSYNYTYSAANNNDENLVLINDRSSINKINEDFQNLISTSELSKEQNTEKATNFLINFANSLKAQVSIFIDDYEHDNEIKEGYKLAQENNGALEFFKARIDSIYTTAKNKLNKADETKILIKSGMNSIFEEAKNDKIHYTKNRERYIEEQKDSDLKIPRDHQTEIQNEINKYENNIKDIELDQNRLKQEIEQAEFEINNIDIEIGKINFWSTGTVINLILLAIITLYLVTFFVSAMYKIFYEANDIVNLLSANLPIPDSKPYDPKAILKVFRKDLFIGLASVAFAIFPLLLVNFKLIKRDIPKWLDFVVTLISIFILDVIVAIFVSKEIAHIEQIKTQEPNNWNVISSFNNIDFYLIFLFGALPLFISKFVTYNVFKAFSLSNSIQLNKEKGIIRKLNKIKINNLTKKINQLDKKRHKIDVPLNVKIQEMTSIKNKINNIIEQSQIEINNLNNRLSNELNEMQNLLNDLRTQVDSGSKTILIEAVKGRINCLKEGWTSYLINTYAEGIVSQKSHELENLLVNWYSDEKSI